MVLNAMWTTPVRLASLDEPMEQIYAALIDGQDDETADWIYDLLQKGEAKAIYDLLQEGADNGNDPG